MVCNGGRKDDALWQKVKIQVTRSTCCGTKAGQWSARKAQYASKEFQNMYKQKYGNQSPYCGPKTRAQRSMQTWTSARWRTKSGLPSSLTDERYLPQTAIRKLSDAEYARTSRKKHRDSARGQQFSRQPHDIAQKVAKVWRRMK